MTIHAKSTSDASSRYSTRTLLWVHRRRLAAGLALLLVNRSSTLVIPAASKWLVDDVALRQQWHLVWWIAAAIAAATSAEALTSFGLLHLLGAGTQRVVADLRRFAGAHVLRLPIEYFDSIQVGAVVSRIMADPEGVRTIIGSGLAEVVGSILTACLALAILAFLNWRMTIVIAGLVAVATGVLIALFDRLGPTARDKAALFAAVNGRLTQVLAGIRTIKVYTSEGRESLLFARAVHILLRKLTKWLRYVNATKSCSTVLTGAVAIVITVGSRDALRAGAMSPGDVVLYTMLANAIVAPIAQIASMSGPMSEARAGLQRIQELLRQPSERPRGLALPSLQRIKGRVSFEHVHFAYAPGVGVLKDVSFDVAPGRTVAIVGPSGSGKTTLASLIAMLYRPTAGRLLIDGIDLSEVDLSDYRRHVAIVMQDNFLFDGTIADNVAYGRPGATRAEIASACRTAHCDSFVEQWAEGYDTRIGERGIRLSGGQRQRLAIARAILADRRILVFDEATSNLDLETEAIVREALTRLRRGRTTFVIAHRLSTIQDADEILVMVAGSIVQRGTHTDLVSRDGPYRRIWSVPDTPVLRA